MGGNAMTEIEKLKRENEALKSRCYSLGRGLLCEFCPLECRYRQQEYKGPSKEI